MDISPINGSQNLIVTQQNSNNKLNSNSPNSQPSIQGTQPIQSQKKQGQSITGFIGNVLNNLNINKSSSEQKQNQSQEEELVEIGATGGTQIKKEEEKATDNQSSVLMETGQGLKSLVTNASDVKTLKRSISKKNIEFEERYKQKQRKCCLIYQDNIQKEYWDIFITALLLYSCMLIPYRIAFVKTDTDEWIIALFSIDVFFLMDLIFCFFSTYQDDDYQEIDDRKQIAKNYLQGWFAIDISAIFPFDMILQVSTSNSSTDVNGLVRFARFGRLYKLVKLTRLLRVIKVMAKKNKMLKVFTKNMNVPEGFDQLLFFLVLFLILSHTVSCLFVIIASFQDESWLTGYEEIDDYAEGDFYALSLYWTITTITTVGYGDISATNTSERWFCSFIMIVGVISFSFANGSLGLIITQMNHKQQLLKDKLSVLEKIKKNYNLSEELFIKCKRNLEYNQNNEYDELNRFLDDLPPKLKVDISLFIYEERYKHIRFLDDKSSSFLQWVCRLLRQQQFQDHVHIYHEDEDITQIHFLLKGKASFVLPQYQNIEYICVNIGDEFGIIDMMASSVRNEFDFDRWMQNKQKLQRQFAVMSVDDTTELLSLSLKDLNGMRKEFNDCYDQLFDYDINKRMLGKALRLQCRAIKSCKKQIRKQIEIMEEQQAQIQNIKSEGQPKQNKQALERKVKLVYDRVENLYVDYCEHYQSEPDQSSSSISDTNSDDEEGDQTQNNQYDNTPYYDDKNQFKILNVNPTNDLQDNNEDNKKIFEKEQLQQLDLIQENKTDKNDADDQQMEQDVISSKYPYFTFDNINNRNKQLVVKTVDSPDAIRKTVSFKKESEHDKQNSATVIQNKKSPLFKIHQKSYDAIDFSQIQNTPKKIEESKIDSLRSEEIKSESGISSQQQKEDEQNRSVCSVKTPKVHLTDSQNQFIEKDEFKTNQNILATEISLSKQFNKLSINDETINSQMGKKGIGALINLQNIDAHKDDTSSCNQNISMSQGNIQNTRKSYMPHGQETMAQTLKGIASLMRQQTEKSKVTENQPAERTAQNILKTRHMPKKNASKEAKNMLNSLSSSLRRQANDVMGGSNYNSLSPLKSPSQQSLFFGGTPTNNLASPMISPNNHRFNLHQLTQQQKDKHQEISNMLVTFLKNQIGKDINNQIVIKEFQKEEESKQEDDKSVVSKIQNAEQIACMSDSQKMSMMLGLLMNIQKGQDELDKEVKDVKENHKLLTVSMQSQIEIGAQQRSRRTSKSGIRSDKRINSFQHMVSEKPTPLLNGDDVTEIEKEPIECIPEEQISHPNTPKNDEHEPEKSPK